MDNKLYGKTIIWDGDSICGGGIGRGNWARRIADRNSMICKNYAIGGGTIAQGYPLPPSGNPRHSVSLTLDKMYEEYPDADYIILEGGTNDADIICDGRSDNVALGDFDLWDFSGNYDRETFCGALESIFFRAVNYWAGKKIGFIIAQKMGPVPEHMVRRRFYFDKAVEICRKWGIPYIDLWNGCYLNPLLESMYDSSKTPEENTAEDKCFYTDGQHLTAKGYDFTSEILEAWIRTL